MAGDCPQLSIREISKTFMVVPWVLGLLFGLAKSGLSQEILVDRLVAEVNGEALTYSQVMNKVKRGNVVEVGAFPAKPEDPPFEIALQDLINQTLISQKIEEVGLEVTDDKVDKQIDSFLERRGLDRTGLMDALRQQGASYDDYFEDFRKQMLFKQFQGRFILPAVKISDKDIEIFYFKMLGSTPESLKLKLRQLVIKIEEDAPDSVKQEKTKLLQSITEKLNRGMAFADAVKIYSEAPGASDDGGLMPPMLLKDMAPALVNAIGPLEVGEFSKPVALGSRFYLFYLEGKELSDTSDFESKKKNLEMKLREREANRETLRWLENQRNISKIKILRDNSH